MAAENVKADGGGPRRDGAAHGLVGQTIGDFEIRQEIGRGGMGIVYEAWQISLQRPIALKVLSNTATMPRTAIERFKREARAAAKLHHANIVPIYAQGEHEGTHYYAMELIRGQSVYQLIQGMRGDAEGSHLAITKTQASDQRGEAWSMADSAAGGAQTVTLGGSGTRPSGAVSRTTVEQFDTIARLCSSVASALEYAHEAGVIHRDIKPHNLILGADGRLCVSDFGLARVLEQPGVTMTGEFLGSPLYMSPEQIRGGSTKTDHRTDIYSLGATMYEWMTLSPPFPGQTREQVITLIMTSEAAPPASLNPDIPTDLETICLRALEKDPKSRYQTAGDMAADLQRYLDRRVIKAHRAGPIIRGKKFVQRHPVGSLVAVIGLVMLLAVGALFKQRGQSRAKEAALQETTSQLDVAQAKISLRDEQAQQLTQDRAEAVEQLEGIRGVLGAVTQGEDRLAMALAQGQALGAGLIPGAVSGGKPKQADFGAQLDAVEREAARQLPDALIAAQLVSVRLALETTQAQIAPDSADGYYLQAAVSEDDRAALALLDRALDQDAGHYNAGYLKLAILCRMGRFEDMRAGAQRLTELRPEAPRGWLLRGAADLFAGDAEHGLVDLDKALELDDQLPWTHTLRGLCLTRLDQLGRGIQACSLALALAPDHAIAYAARGRAQYYLGVYQAALNDAEEVVRLMPDAVGAYIFRGECHDKLLDFDAAIADYNKAISLPGGYSMTLVAKLAWSVLNAREVQTRAAAAAEAAASQEATPESIKPDEPKETSRPIHDDNFNWLDSWLKEKMGGPKPAPPSEPNTSGYPFRLLRPGVR